MAFSIGEFSKITGLSVKTLRFYHEKGVLLPDRVEGVTGYRFYSHENAETARIIKTLRDMEFSLEEIKMILAECAQDDGDLLTRLEYRKAAVKERIQSQKNVLKALDQVIVFAKENRQVANQTMNEIEVKEIPVMLVGGVRMKGRYNEMGKAFGLMGRKLNRHINGPAMCLYYDGEYKESDADFEPCFPLKKVVKADGVDVRELAECKAVCLKHVGPYERLGATYERLFAYVNEQGLKVSVPTREVYLKGPGMIFRGNPEKYVTEVQLVVESDC